MGGGGARHPLALVRAYQEAAGTRLTGAEKQAVAPCAAAAAPFAAAALYHASLAGFTDEPAARPRWIPFLHLAEWLPVHRGDVLG